MDFKKIVAERIATATEIDINQIINMLEVPPQADMGDYAFPCFTLAKTLRKAPPIIAKDLATNFIIDDIIDKVMPVGGYLNFYIKTTAFIKDTVETVLSERDRYGSSDMGIGQKVLVEFSSPNIAKPFHIGHLVNTITGNSIEKIYKNLGYETVKLNHLGDYGTQFGKLIVAYEKWGDDEVIAKDPIKELLKIYVRFHEEAENNPSLIDEARLNFKRLEDAEEHAVELWKKFRELSLIEFKQLYDEFGVSFDSYDGESFYSDKMEEVVDIIKSKNLMVDSDGAKIVELDAFGLPPSIIIKSDGSTIYLTRDIAAILYRHRHYNFDKCLYVVGNTQALHFKQLFAVSKLIGFDFADNCKHIGTALVKFGDKKFASRKGDVIFAKEVVDEAVEKTLGLMNEKNPDMINKEDTARKVGMGAIIYTFLKNNMDRDINFTWEDILSFDGESGPYVQYSFVRGKSILRKADIEYNDADFANLKTDEERNIATLLNSFGQAIIDAATRYEPFIITRNITELAKAFNKFYNTHPILNAEDEVKKARLALTEAVTIVLENGMGLLGMQAPENM